MSRIASNHIHLLNMCVMHDSEPGEMVALLALKAFAAGDFEKLNAWVSVAEGGQESRFDILGSFWKSASAAAGAA